MVAKVQLCLAFGLIVIIGSVYASGGIKPDPAEGDAPDIKPNEDNSPSNQTLANMIFDNEGDASGDVDERGLLNSVSGIGLGGSLPGPLTGHTLLFKNGKLLDFELNVLTLGDLANLNLQINNILDNGHGHTRGSHNSENGRSSCIEQLDNLLKDKQLASLDRIILNILNQENGELLLMKVIRVAMHLGSSSQLDDYLLLSITKQCTRSHTGVSKNYIKFAQKILTVKTVFGSKAARKQVEKYLRKNK